MYEETPVRQRSYKAKTKHIQEGTGGEVGIWREPRDRLLNGGGVRLRQMTGLRCSARKLARRGQREAAYKERYEACCSRRPHEDQARDC
jgi:hypothetical protein